MMHHERVRRAIAEQAPHVISSAQSGLDDMLRLWDACSSDSEIGQFLPVSSHAPCAGWSGAIGEVYPVAPSHHATYHVSAIDGSQIYPDPHRVATAYAVNIAYVDIQYGPHAYADINALPYTYLADTLVSSVYVDKLRLEHEVYLASQMPEQAGVMLDGPLTWWPLQGTSHFTNSVHYTQTLADRSAWYLGYMSSPQTQHVVNALRTLERVYETDYQLSMYATIVTDTQLMARVLPEWYRTPMLWMNDQVCAYYPAYLRPYICYCNTGYEIARIEMPHYIAVSEDRVNQIMVIVRDQIEKGHGYPVALAEAHEAAVIREADRQFFFATVEEHTTSHAASQKQRQKHRPLI